MNHAKRRAANDAMQQKGLFSPWSELSQSSQKQLLRAGRCVVLQRGDHLASSLGLVAGGTLGVARQLANGRRVLCTLFHSGDLIDLRRDDRQRQGELVALSRVGLMLLDENQMALGLPQYSDLTEMFLQQTRRQFARMRDHATDLACKTPLERVASLLLAFRYWPAETTGTDEPDAIRLPVRRSDLADYLGVTPETMTRTMKRLEREGLIEAAPDDLIRLVDLAALRAMSEGEGQLLGSLRR